MRTNLLRSLTVALGMSACTIAQAQYTSPSTTYSAPAKWNNFNVAPNANLFLTASGDEALAQTAPELPAPAPAAEVIPSPAATHPMPAPMMEMSSPIGGGDCGDCQSPYAAAAAAPWGGVNTRPPLAPYFAGANLLFLTLENNSARVLASGLGSGFNSSLVNPAASTGFDVTLGRYLGRGRYGLGLTYFLWNPGVESVTRIGTPGSILASMPAYRDIAVDAGSGVESIYDIIAGPPTAYAGAAAVRVTRNLRFQGIEANLYSFGLMGAQRVAYDICNTPACMRRFGCGNARRGFGGAGGPLRRACGSRLSVMTSHGFRWFQARDDFEIAYNIDGTVGYQADDLYENVNVENNLYGYQFGSRLIYCIMPCLNLNVGGRFGIFGNDAQVRRRVGTRNTTAYRVGMPTDLIDTRASDTSLATLGELDLGLGYRVTCGLTVRGGYRLLGISGVATSVGSLATNYSSV
ncbi:MAG: BBP7 family outer membrane beta-barrel protein, partial [Pirellulales bacterium]|nr:BBP7 family outer membrane beta-barrel protein [Pirellulales bacterium]